MHDRGYVPNLVGLPWPSVPVSAATRKAAEGACASKEPLIPPELDSKKNPHYAAQFHQEVLCLNAGGLKVTELPNAEGWNYAEQPTMSEKQSNKLQHDCQRKAFGGGK
ncbi:hypothetical protein VV02_01830 [Luteipulveratus mongoliensis]|uniref:Uncharacterized protein n=2 Tax=Luteipulveratus mongoliensis TaxID=571913 RepID=A0A0K1JPA5_9MICO|nr:hypothetical protein VV02_01830 [Luteipulveratus mongoliensis]